MPGAECWHRPSCPSSGQTDALAAVIVAAHPEQGWYLLCNGLITFDDIGVIAGDSVVIPRRPIPGTLTEREPPYRTPERQEGEDVMQDLIGFWTIGMVIVVMATAYMLPTLIAWLRHAPDIAAVALLNATLGWTLIVWIAALAMAMRKAPAPPVQVFQVNAPTSPPQSPAYWDAYRFANHPDGDPRFLPPVNSARTPE